MGYREDFGIAAPKVLVGAATRCFAGFDDVLVVELERRKSEAGPLLGFLGLAASFTLPED